MKAIKDINELKQLAKKEKPLECFVPLNFGLRSSKTIAYLGDERWWILNEIDDTEQNLTTGQLMDKNLTLVGEALAAGCLMAY